MKPKPNVMWFEVVFAFLLPVLMSCQAEWAPAWLWVPTNIVLGLMWIGCMAELTKKPEVPSGDGQ